MKRMTGWLGGMAMLASLFLAGAAHAQATRTWVSGVGDDVNPCSRTAPCKTFAGAISKTAAGGVINCLDPGGFGAVTITKSMTIDCTGTMGSVLAANTNGVIVNSPGGWVTLRGISIEGNTTGLVGVNIIAAATVVIDNCKISQFNAGNAAGVLFGGSGGGELLVSTSAITGNGNGTLGGGIVIRPTGGGVKSTINRVEANNNSNAIVSDPAAGAGVNLQIVDVITSGNTNIGISARGATSIVADRVTASVNGTGLQSDGGSSQILLANSTVTGNGTGVSFINGGLGYSYVTNQINANGTDGTFPSNLARR